MKSKFIIVNKCGIEIIGYLFCNLEVPDSAVLNFLVIFSQLLYILPSLVLI